MEKYTTAKEVVITKEKKEDVSEPMLPMKRPLIWKEKKPTKQLRLFEKLSDGENDENV